MNCWARFGVEVGGVHQQIASLNEQLQKAVGLQGLELARVG